MLVRMHSQQPAFACALPIPLSHCVLACVKTFLFAFCFNWGAFICVSVFDADGHADGH